MEKVKNIKESVRDILKNYKREPTHKQIQTTDFPNHPNTILLVTGGCGFIGSNFINLIMERFDNINVINIAMLCQQGKCRIWRISPRYTFIKGNLCSMDLVRHVFDTHKPTHIVHFAAQSHVQNSFSDALQYTQDNIVGTHTS